jgi:Ribbon-helix-helix protein, copG family
MDLLQQLVETLRVLARTNEPNRVVLIEKAINEYLNDKAGIVRLSLERLRSAIDREEAEKRPIED